MYLGFSFIQVFVPTSKPAVSVPHSEQFLDSSPGQYELKRFICCVLILASTAFHKLSYNPLNKGQGGGEAIATLFPTMIGWTLYIDQRMP
jgi:hypothetical protein